MVITGGFGFLGLHLCKRCSVSAGAGNSPHKTGPMCVIKKPLSSFSITSKECERMDIIITFSILMFSLAFRDRISVFECQIKPKKPAIFGVLDGLIVL